MGLGASAVGRMYSQHLGAISDEHFQAALDRFELGRFIQAEPIPFGNFGQNVFVSSTGGEYVRLYSILWDEKLVHQEK